MLSLEWSVPVDSVCSQESRKLLMLLTPQVFSLTWGLFDIYLRSYCLIFPKPTSEDQVAVTDLFGVINCKKRPRILVKWSYHFQQACAVFKNPRNKSLANFTKRNLFELNTQNYKKSPRSVQFFLYIFFPCTYTVVLFGN